MRPTPLFGTHLDADTLAALAENSLLEDEKEAAFAHLAECEICREHLRVNAELKEFNWNAGSAPHNPSRSLWVSRSAGVAAGFAFALIATLWLVTSQFQRSNISPRAMHATPKLSILAPHGIKGLWGANSLQKLSTNDRLAARNFHRFSKELTLTAVSFGSDHTTRGEDEFGMSGLYQIKLETALGERLVTFQSLPLTIYK